MSYQSRREFLKWGGTIGGTAIIAGCTGDSGRSGSSGTTDEGGQGSTDQQTDEDTTTPSDSELSKKELNVLITYLPDMSYSPVVAADQFGYFEDVGFNNVNIEHSLTSNPLQVLTGSDYDIVLASHTDIMTGRSKGVPVRPLLTTQGNTPWAYTSLDSNSIDELQDIVGKTIGIQNEVDVKTYSNAIFNNEFSQSEKDQTETTFTGFAIQNILTNQVDAMSLFPTNADQISLQQTGEADFSYLYWMDYIDVVGNASMTTESFAEENPDVLREFTRAHAKGLNDCLDSSMKTDVAEACITAMEEADVGETFAQGADPVAVEEEAFERFQRFRPIDEWDQNGAGWNPPERIENTQQLLIDNGEIAASASSSVDVLADNTFINEVYDENGELVWTT